MGKIYYESMLPIFDSLSVRFNYESTGYTENVYYTISLLNHSTMKLYQLAAMIFINSKLNTTVVILGSIFTS